MVKSWIVPKHFSPQLSGREDALIQRGKERTFSVTDMTNKCIIAQVS